MARDPPTGRGAVIGRQGRTGRIGGEVPVKPCAPIAIKTDRLLLRRWQASDVEPMSRINADPEVMRWIGSGAVVDAKRTQRAIERWEAEWDDRGFGLFAVEQRSTRELLGFTGLSVPSFLPEVLPAVEIGWRLSRAAWGQGLATEAARAVLAFAFGERELERVVSIAQVGNDASVRIMSKLGMRHERTTIDPTCGRPVEVHEICAEDWLTRA